MLGNQISLTNNVAKQVVSVTATQNQTDFTVQGGYRINQLGVYRNGVRLVDGRDYIARNGSSVTLVSQGANAGDAMEFVVFDDFRVADALSVNTGGTVNASVNITGALQMGTGTSIFSPAENELTLGTNSAERVRIKSNGFVGIGTDNPTRVVHVQDGSNTLLSLDSTDTNADLVQSDTGGSTRIRSNSGALEFYTAGDASSTNATNSEIRVTVSAGGSVGIGTDRPITNLMILGSESRAGEGLVRIRNDHTTTGQPAWGLGITRQANGVRALLLGSDDNNNAAICVNGNNNLIFGKEVSGTWTQHVQINSSGEVGIGTTNTAAKFQVAGSVMVGPDGTTNQYQGIQLRNGRDSSANIATGFIDFRNNLNIPDGHMFVDHGTDGSSAIIFGTTPAGDRTTDRRQERLRIHSHGAVTKAANPLLKTNMGSTYGSSGSLITSPNTAILQSSAEIDKGDNGWSTSGSNGYTFVCPVAGVYAVHAHFSLNDIAQGSRYIFVMGYTDGGGSLPLSTYVEVMDTSVHDYQNYSYYNTWNFSAGTRIGFGLNSASGTVSGVNSQWGIHLLQ